MGKPTLVKLTIMSGIVAVGFVSSAITGFGTADTSVTPATPTVVATDAPAAPLDTPAPTPQATVAPTAPLTVQQQLDNHESRITALEQATPAPQTPVVTAPTVVVVAPGPTPVPVYNGPCSHNQICTSN